MAKYRFINVSHNMCLMQFSEVYWCEHHQLINTPRYLWHTKSPEKYVCICCMLAFQWVDSVSVCPSKICTYMIIIYHIWSLFNQDYTFQKFHKKSLPLVLRFWPACNTNVCEWLTKKKIAGKWGILHNHFLYKHLDYVQFNALWVICPNSYYNTFFLQWDCSFFSTHL